ncbi:3201_t:CDS:2, partial [Paraglomus occultum]
PTRKRSHEEAIVDCSDSICAELVQPFDNVPCFARDVQSLIEALLLRKLPVSPYIMQKITLQQPNQLTYLEVGYGLLEERITNALSDSTGEAAKMGGSEDLLHYPIDSLWNINDSVLIMWGEEKQASMQEALEDKFGKLDPLQFMICYAGHIRFYAIGLNSKTDELQIQWIAACVLAGLTHLHENGFLHGDVRLPNILYVPPPTDPNDTVGTYVLIDFEHGGPTNSAAGSEDEMEVVDDPWLTQGTLNGDGRFDE